MNNRKRKCTFKQTLRYFCPSCLLMSQCGVCRHIDSICASVTQASVVVGASVTSVGFGDVLLLPAEKMPAWYCFSLLSHCFLGSIVAFVCGQLQQPQSPYHRHSVGTGDMDTHSVRSRSSLVLLPSADHRPQLTPWLHPLTTHSFSVVQTGHLCARVGWPHCILFSMSEVFIHEASRN